MDKKEREFRIIDGILGIAAGLTALLVLIPIQLWGRITFVEPNQYILRFEIVLAVAIVVYAVWRLYRLAKNR